MNDAIPASQAPRLPLQGPHRPGNFSQMLPAGFFSLRLILQPDGTIVELTRPDTLVGRHTGQLFTVWQLKPSGQPAPHAGRHTCAPTSQKSVLSRQSLSRGWHWAPPPWLLQPGRQKRSMSQLSELPLKLGHSQEPLLHWPGRVQRWRHMCSPGTQVCPGGQVS